ncbi:MAG: cystathionine beta-synthase [Alphaproteobacteria bacterium]|nr:cystathionine beta-synthase [Alphaproteobacteria bacterium]
MTAAKPFGNVLQMIGDTPMVEVTRLDTGPCRLFLKLESQNPGGSIKDRIGLSMIEAAERDGTLKPGGTLIEATAGNTGLGLALVAAQKGYRLILIIPDKMSLDKIHHLRALGVEIVMTRSDVGKGHPDYYQDMAERMAAEIPGAFWVNQFANPANPEAHFKTTGPEIWEQMDHDVDAVVCGVGSGGTITGLGRYFAQVQPDLKMVVADPDGSVVGHAALTGEVKDEVGSWLVEGIGEDFIPPNCDLTMIQDAEYVSDKEAFAAARDLLLREGLLGGSSTGTLLAAALKWCRKQTEPKRVVSFVCDTGNKYLAKVYNDAWMIDNGLLDRETHGDLRDLITRRADKGEAVSVSPDDTLLVAYGRMRMFDVSQLPVLDGDGGIAGIIDESDILFGVNRDPALFRDTVGTVMTRNLNTVSPDTPAEALIPLFREDKVALVKDDAAFYGLVTKIDFINHMRGKLV